MHGLTEFLYVMDSDSGKRLSAWGKEMSFGPRNEGLNEQDNVLISMNLSR